MRLQRTLPRRYALIPLVICLSLVSLLLTACGGTIPAKTYTIGVVHYHLVLEPVLASFKTQMAALGYMEGKNVTYIYRGELANDPRMLGGEVKRLLDKQVDLLLTLGTQPTLAAKKGVAGTAIPVVFAPVTNPVKQGIVESVTHPGGNVTGVQIINSAPKAMEWLLKLVPGTKTIYVPYHPEDRVAVTTIIPLPDAAAQLGVELVLDAVHTPEAVMAAIETLPKDASCWCVRYYPCRRRALRLRDELGRPREAGGPVGGPDSQREKASRSPCGDIRVFLADQPENSHNHWPRHPG